MSVENKPDLQEKIDTHRMIASFEWTVGILFLASSAADAIQRMQAKAAAVGDVGIVSFLHEPKAVLLNAVVALIGIVGIADGTRRFENAKQIVFDKEINQSKKK